MSGKQSEKISLWGIVQGVGFRPFVAKTADRLRMKGEVRNIGGLVEITLTDTPQRIADFIDVLLREKPAPAEIVHIKRETVSYRTFDDFSIIKSHDGSDEAAMIPADLAICPHCLEELYDEKNPRYQHPFISCMICGPRYTIIDKIPYDRDNTSMVDFPMCDFCEGEYTDLHDRRYHAQTISCHDCGPSLLWKGHTGASAPGSRAFHAKAEAAELLDHAAGILAKGGVTAFKSVGGYNLVADPRNDAAVAKLRRIKHREEKPFAVMFRSLEQIKEFCHVDPVEEKLLASSARPILLLEHKELPYKELNKSRFIGSFLPSLAAQYMLLDRISPLIFTSANLSDMPMIKDEDDMFSLFEKEPLIDGILYNKRRILVRADDSVARVIDGQPQMIRRSKGYAPVPLYVDMPQPSDPEKGALSKRSIFASGGQLKNSFALTKGSFVYMSQFFGDMDTVENQQVYSGSLDSLKSLFRINPDAVVCDLHPLYYTTGFAERYAREHELPLLKVQHHHAHVASVMAENNLSGKVIGVSFDGTGYGVDNCIWGGEFFLCEGPDALRIAHLKYVDMLSGDASVKDAARSALSYLHAHENGYLTEDKDPRTSAGATGSTLHESRSSAPTHYDLLQTCRIAADCRQIPVDLADIIEFGEERLLSIPDARIVLPALKQGINTVKSSSMGRLFDAVSCLLGIKDYNDYEGQCAILLEDAAAFAQKHPGKERHCDLALDFHNKIIELIVEQCRITRRDCGATQVALTGGTFQNKILMAGVLKKLRTEGFTPYYNISVSPNDGGIALGQAYIAMAALQSKN
ncbi:MAG: carbamoyltransferase HypF [Bacillota bacterium]|nr:carbamoyltransferase HypF [Bacillota bacterium]